jgi:hypothetical protein
VGRREAARREGGAGAVARRYGIEDLGRLALVVLARELDVDPVSLLPVGDADPNDVIPAERLRRLLPEDQAALQKVVRRAREEREAYGGQG